VNADEIQAIEPALHGSYYGAFYTPSDATGDTHKFTRGLAAACARLGAQFVYEADVERVSASNAGLRVKWKTNDRGDSKQEGLADAIVICAGTASRRFATILGDRVNIYPVKGYSITVHLDDPLSQGASPWVSILDDEAKIVTSRLGIDRLRVAGTAELNGFNRDIRDDRVRPLVAWTRRLFPEISTSRVGTWAGLRPMTPSMLPRVGPGRRAGVFYNTGHGHLGWTLSAATAGMVADAVDFGLRTVKPRFGLMLRNAET
jgi:D-amino-acid dehydrogenase